MLSHSWLWWSTLILLLLRLHAAETSDEEVDESTTSIAIKTTTAKPKPKTADELGVPKCSHNHACVNNGVCALGPDGFGRCLCPRSCTASIPMNCKNSGGKEPPCLLMGGDYTKKYRIIDPTCHKQRCVCPPMFEPVNLTKFPIKTLLPVKCDKRELKAVGVAHPSDSVYKGADVILYCCINMDPTNFIDASAVTFVQNETVTREPTKHPFKQALSDYDALITPSCWELEIQNVQLSDSGSYMCIVNPAGYPIVNYTINFQVKEHEKRHHPWFRRAKKLKPHRQSPRMIQNLAITTNETAANITWEIQEGPQLKIDLRLVRRTGFEGKEVWSKQNVLGPVSIGSLRPATPYTLFVSVKDGQMEPFELSEHFTTAEAKPLPPKFVGVRVGYNSGPSSTGSFLNCEVEWRAPPITNGRIVKYYVRVRGQVRRTREGGPLVADDFPQAVDKKCANWDEQELAERGINPIEFSSDLYFCKYGPLKPNRNYTVTVWAENAAGKSSPITFPKTCVTHYAEPDDVARPTTSVGSNHSSFSLAFNHKPEDTNGPITCYYIAVVPLPRNVSLNDLPSPNALAMDNHAKAFSNNLQQFSEKKIYFAYIAESYTELPDETIIGDDELVKGMQPCNMLYLSRYRAADAPIQQGIKYTGFLIVRVDKEKESPRDDSKEDRNRSRKVPSRYLRSVSLEEEPSGRSIRQLHLSGPVYGYSSYFKPVFLEGDEGGIVSTILAIVAVFVVLAVLVFVVGLIFMQRRGMVKNWCPLKIVKEVPERVLLKPTYHPIPVEDLPSEFLLRHRDSDFMFTQEFESLPSYPFDAVASNKKENALKNRYNDIRAFDCTRVKLKKVPGQDQSDYINANFINGWGDSGKKFIAAQGPLENTVDDFWRMIWEQDCRVVVMVANLEERKRNQCAKYWPEDCVSRYGDIKVTPTGVSYNACFTIRSFDVIDVGTSSRLSPSRKSDFGGSIDSHVGSEYANVPTRNGKMETSLTSDHSTEIRHVVQYHFTAWNDYRAPECSTGLLRFITRLRLLREFTDNPVVVHCSAGVGRTGTFVAIDSALDQIEAERRVDIHNFVCELRKQRNLMVQSLEQYTFIYKALAEWYLFGITDMEACELEDHFERLIDLDMRDDNGVTRLAVRNDGDGPHTKLEEEFKRLERKLEQPPKISFATKDENIMKNRFEGAVPFDRNRVALSPMLGYSDTSYINASEVKGYFYPYIMAQDPVSQPTVFDFWRMISEKHVSTIVMLSPEEDWSLSEKYWPEDLNTPMTSAKNPHEFIIKVVAEEAHDNHFVRTIVFRNAARNEEWQTVTQYSITDWPAESEVPDTSESVLWLVGRVLASQSKKETDYGPTVVHCRNGSSRSGLFVCISLLLERLRAEDRVDVFQTVKSLQMDRPMVFTKLIQYEFCYRAVLDYIQKSHNK